jgi:hypothetical protein
MNISRFLAEINNNYVYKPKLFEVRLSNPFDNKKMLRLRTEISSFPGVSFTTASAIRQSGYGPVEDRPYGVIQTDIEMSHIVDEGGEVYEMFINWANLIGGFKTWSINEDPQGRPGLAYTTEYKINYAQDVAIIAFDEKGSKRFGATLYEAWPSAVNPISVGWGESDYAKLSVSYRFISFTTWTSTPNLGGISIF